jgi:hypothetical protein
MLSVRPLFAPGIPRPAGRERPLTAEPSPSIAFLDCYAAMSPAPQVDDATRRRS